MPVQYNRLVKGLSVGQLREDECIGSTSVPVEYG